MQTLKQFHTHTSRLTDSNFGHPPAPFVSFATKSREETNISSLQDTWRRAFHHVHLFSGLGGACDDILCVRVHLLCAQTVQRRQVGDRERSVPIKAAVSKHRHCVADNLRHRSAEPRNDRQAAGTDLDARASICARWCCHMRLRNGRWSHVDAFALGRGRCICGTCKSTLLHCRAGVGPGCRPRHSRGAVEQLRKLGWCVCQSCRGQRSRKLWLAMGLFCVRTTGRPVGTSAAARASGASSG